MYLRLPIVLGLSLAGLCAASGVARGSAPVGVALPEVTFPDVVPAVDGHPAAGESAEASAGLPSVSPPADVALPQVTFPDRVPDADGDQASVDAAATPSEELPSITLPETDALQTPDAPTSHGGPFEFEVVLEGGATWFEPPLRVLAGAREGREAINLLTRLTAAPAPTLSLDATVHLRLDADGHPQLGLRRARLVRAGQVTYEAGYDYTGWSFFDMAHPLDPQRRHDFRIDPEDLSRNYADPFVRASTSLGAGRFTAMAGSDTGELEQLELDRLFGALRYERQYAGTRLAGQLVHSPEVGNRVGMSVDAELGRAIVVAELDVSRRRELRQPNSPTTAREAGSYATGVLGLRYSAGSGRQFDVGYHRNAQGYNAREWARHVAAEDATVTAIARGDYSGARFLGESTALARDRTMRRNYLFASYTAGDSIFPYSLTLGGHYGADDASGMAFVELGRELGARGTARLTASAPFGAGDSEFGRKPTQLTLQLQFFL